MARSGGGGGDRSVACPHDPSIIPRSQACQGEIGVNTPFLVPVESGHLTAEPQVIAMSTIDLHIHSSISLDGEFLPGEILSMCEVKGLQAISITDHNSVKGVRLGIELARSAGITLIPGIEIDCTFDDLHLHVLGYNIDIDNPAFIEIERAALEQEHSYFPKLVTRLQELDFHIEQNDVLNQSPTSIPSPEYVGEFLLNSAENRHDKRLLPYRDGGDRSDMPYLNFYRDFCTKSKPAFIEKQYPDLRSVIQIITQAGGVPILAHPGDSLSDPEKQLLSVVKEGLLGIEAFSSYHSPEMSRYFVDKADEFGILVTCGSDFHGRNKPAIALGSVECEGMESQILEGLVNYPTYRIS